MVVPKKDDTNGGGGFRGFARKAKENIVVSLLVAGLVMGAVWLIVVDIG